MSRRPESLLQPQPSPKARALRPADWHRWGSIIVLVIAGLIAYFPSLKVPFYLDDGPSIIDNPTIRDLRALGTVLQPPGQLGETVGGRPVLNLSLALSHAISGNAPWGYHLLNLVIHLLAALLLFGLIRRTLMRPAPAAGLRDPATLPAFTVALLWLLHPLQTESITYVIQRAESLAGLFYLLTLYAYLRGATAVSEAGSRWWFVIATIACLLGMGTKEVMVTAPLAILLYDRAYLAGSFRSAWRQRAGALVALSLTWLPLLYLVLGTAGRGTSAGFGQGLSIWSYALTQCRSLVHYLRLVCWPHPLVLDYGTAVVRGAFAVLPQILFLAALLTGVLWALIRRPRLGFPAVMFFLLLAPSSSIVPIVSQTMAEHRMYLALAPVLLLLVIAVYRLCAASGMVALIVIAVGLGTLTWHRNVELQHPETVWRQVIAACPDNARAHLCLGTLLNKTNRVSAAIIEYETALRLQPDYIEALNNLGNALQQEGRIEAAIQRYQAVLRLKPDWPDTHYNLGLAYQRMRRLDDAITEYQIALRAAPNDADIHFNLANVLGATGRLPEAITHYEKALELRPGFTAAQRNLQLVRQAAGSGS